jgi:hypothetical protein
MSKHCERCGFDGHTLQYMTKPTAANGF